MSGFMSGRGSANLLTRVTAALAALFFTTSLVLAILASTPSRAPSLFDEPASQPATESATPPAPAAAPAAEPAFPEPEPGAAHQVPAVPQGQ